jgi:hypothetical protein
VVKLLQMFVLTLVPCLQLKFHRGLLLTRRTLQHPHALLLSQLSWCHKRLQVHVSSIVSLDVGDDPLERTPVLVPATSREWDPMLWEACTIKQEKGADRTL